MLQVQLRLLSSDVGEERRRIGELMIDEGLISRAQLDRALHRQLELSRMRLGEILMEMGAVTRDQLDDIARKQLRALVMAGEV
jgi:type IV pilus assembly protein PilB